MADFLLRALLGGLGIAAVTGPLGCFIVWRRMAYFGDTLAHSALLGIALGILLDIQLNLAILTSCLLLALALVLLQQQRQIAADTILGILAHTTLSLGIIAISLMDVRLDLMGYLFGDLLAISNTDLAWIFGGGLLTAIILFWLWRPLLLMTIHEDLAQAEGVPVRWVRLALMLLISVVIALSMKIVGVLLITSMLIIPAAGARALASTPERMAITASMLGALAICLGLTLSFFADTPAGPSVVVSAFVLFAGSHGLSRLLEIRRAAG